MLLGDFLHAGLARLHSMGSGHAFAPPYLLGPLWGGPRIALRPLLLEDEREWTRVRSCNDEWLSGWEAGDPEQKPPPSFRAWIRAQRRQEREGEGVVLAVESQGHIVGQVSLGAIRYGAIRTASVGYWMDRAHAGYGIMPLAVAMLADWALDVSIRGPRLHRLEIALLPGNHRSRRVAEKVGARYEGVRRGHMYVDGRWRDHEVYALLSEDRGEGFAARFVSRHAVR